MKYQFYKEQLDRWPLEVQHILANYDEESISVRQAYKPFIANYAVQQQKLLIPYERAYEYK